VRGRRNGEIFSSYLFFQSTTEREGRSNNKEEIKKKGMKMREKFEINVGYFEGGFY